MTIGTARAALATMVIALPAIPVATRGGNRLVRKIRSPVRQPRDISV
jgi:hypothetical protein